MTPLSALLRSVFALAAVSLVWVALPVRGQLDDWPAPLSPEDALASMKVRPGLEIELVAAEPLVMDPVAFDWDASGRLWVVEMRDYPNGLTWNQPDDPMNVPGGAVKVLSDSDGDGRYDEATTFLDGLPYPTGIKVWKKGVLVTAAPEIFYAEDTDGDGVADVRETWFEGFSRSNQQHRVNGLAWGLDNWLHVANGDGGGVIATPHGRDEVDIRGNDLRINPVTKEVALLSGKTQNGRYRDDWGNWFGCNNSNPLWHYPLRYEWLEQNKAVAPPRAYVDVPEEPGAAPVYPRSETLARFNDYDRANRFTSVCGPTIYRDIALGAEFEGNAIVCEPVHNLVSRQVLTPNGATFTSTRAPDEQENEFLASTDNWCRPVSVRTGPDGALWMADMYRLVIEHPEWIPLEWQTKLDLRAGSDRGRIYRIYPAGKQPGPVPAFDPSSGAALVALLESPNGTIRDFAHQSLLWGGDRDRKEEEATLAALRQMVRVGDRPTARMHALSVLAGLGRLDIDSLVVALSDTHSGVVRNALCFAKDRVSARQLAALVKPHLGDAFVAKELAGVLGEMKEEAGEDENAPLLLAALLLRYRDEPYVTATALSSVNRDNLGALLRRLSLAYTDERGFREELSQMVPDVEAPPVVLMEKLAAMTMEFHEDSARGRLVETLVSAMDREADRGGGGSDGVARPWQIAVLNGLLSGGAGLDDVSSSPAQRNKLNLLVSRARGALVGEILPEEQRVDAIRLLSCRAVFNGKEDLELLIGWLSPRYSPGVREAVLKALRRAAHPDTAANLIARWDSLGPASRAGALALMVSRREWTLSLLGALEAREIPPTLIDAATRQRLTGSGDETIRSRGQAIFAAAISASRQEVLDRYEAALELPGDPKEGKEVFGGLCVACHRLEGVGNAIGPDLTALTDRSPESLLVAVLDPNRAVEDKFMTYQIEAKDGSQIYGLIGDESANSLTLRGADGSEQQMLRSNIVSMTASGLSLMPEGLEGALSPQQTADLIAYLGSLSPVETPVPVVSARVRPREGGAFELRASKCRVSGTHLVFDKTVDALTGWDSEDGRAEWTAVLDRPGDYTVEWEYAAPVESAGVPWQLLVNGKKVLSGAIESTGGRDTFRTTGIGPVSLAGGDNKVVLKSGDGAKGPFLDLRMIRFVPGR